MTDALDTALELVRSQLGADLTSYKRGTLERRLSFRAAKLGLSDLRDYTTLLRTDPSEPRHLLAALTIKVSSFFRDPWVFDALEREVLSEIAARKAESSESSVRCWSAGCAGGEEAWTLAILLHQLLRKATHLRDAMVFATDIDAEALTIGTVGVYPREALVQTRLGVVDAWFTPRADGFEVAQCLRGLVRFSVDDLTDTTRVAPAESVFGGFDLVLCRNVLIYLSAELQERVLTRLVRSLATGGYLVLGESELPAGPNARTLRTVSMKSPIFQKGEPSTPPNVHGNGRR